MSEFDLIGCILRRVPVARDDVRIGPGDDGAVLAVPPGHELVLSADTLVAGRHFPPDTAAADLGWKVIAVNLSDLAAMGADAAWVTVALTLPERDRTWLTAFADGMAQALTATGAALVGGDLTRGPLSVTVQAAGLLPTGTALRRDGAVPGDAIAVTGSLGDAALALARWQGDQVPADADATWLQSRLTRPTPRLAAGRAARARAHACADISDGLAADLGHILQASGIGATVAVNALPQSPAFARLCPPEKVLAQQLGGDDYELCLCLPREAVVAVAADAGVPLTVIGDVEAEPGLRLVDDAGRRVAAERTGYDHFRC